MNYLAVVPKEVYDLGTIGILCMVIYALVKALTEWFKLRNGSPGLSTQTINDIEVKLSILAEKVPQFEATLNRTAEETHELREIHCGEHAWKDGRPRWYVGEDVRERVKTLHDLLLQYDQKFAVVSKMAVDCPVDPSRGCIINHLVTSYAEQNGPPTSETKVRRGDSKRKKK